MALRMYMLASALIPLVFVLGVLVLFLLGAWNAAAFPHVVIVALLVGIAAALVRMTSQLDASKPAK